MYIRMLLWAVMVLAIEVLLVWGYIALVDGRRIFSTYVALALLVGTVSVMVWLAFVNDFEETWGKLLLTIIGCIVVSYAALVVVAFADLPTAVICERGRTEMDADPKGAGVRVRYEQSRLGPCVFYNPESARTAGGSGD